MVRSVPLTRRIDWTTRTDLSSRTHASRPRTAVPRCRPPAVRSLALKLSLAAVLLAGALLSAQVHASGFIVVDLINESACDETGESYRDHVVYRVDVDAEGVQRPSGVRSNTRTIYKSYCPGIGFRTVVVTQTTVIDASSIISEPCRQRVVTFLTARERAIIVMSVAPPPHGTRYTFVVARST